MSAAHSAGCSYDAQAMRWKCARDCGFLSALHVPLPPSATLCPSVAHTTCEEPEKCAVMGCIARSLAAKSFARDDRRAALVALAIKGSTTPTKHWAHRDVATLTREVLAALDGDES